MITEMSSAGDESYNTKPSFLNINFRSSSSFIVRDRNNCRNKEKRIAYKIKREWELPSIEELNSNYDDEEEEELEVVPRFEKLSLNNDYELLSIDKIAQLSLNDDAEQQLAGVVTSVTKIVELVVVKPPIKSKLLLYIGSPVFIVRGKCNGISLSLSEYVKFGWIIDVFGPTCEPYYCVKPVKNFIELVNEGTELFYLTDHPQTAFISLKRSEYDNRYTVIYSPSKIQNRNKIKEEGEGDFQNYNSKNNNSTNYRSQHRRRRRNKYRNDNLHCSFRSMKPKHSYFDY